MNIRAKMRCDSVKAPNEHSQSEEIRLSAVTDGSEENKSFAKYTPNAGVNMTIDNPAAQGQFRVGQEYYVDFTPAS